MRKLDNSRTIQGLVGVVDVGTTQVCCLIAAPDAAGGQTLLGLGHQRSQGIKSGMVVDTSEAERAVRAAVGQAERMAGVALDSIVLAVACGRLKSSGFVARAMVEGRVEGAVEGGVVRAADIDRVIAGGEAYVERGNGRCLIQLTRSDWQLDSVKGVRDPRGLAGRELSVQLTAITADEAPVRNLVGVIERCHLAVEGLVATPFASAIAVATPEERRAGVLIVDIGAGVTSLAVFADGRFVHADAIPVGGQHITYDIARALAAPVAEAERIKTLYGTLVKAASDAAEFISYPGTGEDDQGGFQTSKARLREIIEPRVEHVFSLVEERLAGAGLVGFASGGVILTGGGSQLLGLDRVWMRRFGGTVRIGRPKPIGRMPPSMCSPAFATVVGLAVGEVGQGSAVGAVRRTPMGSPGYLGRMRQWIGESF